MCDLQFKLGLHGARTSSVEEENIVETVGA